MQSALLSGILETDGCACIHGAKTVNRHQNAHGNYFRVVGLWVT